MALIKKMLKNDVSSFFITNNQKLMFDHSFRLYGTHHRLSAQPKPTKFVIPKVDNVDKIFISSSESLGIFFLKTDIPIYTTLQLSKQLVYKIKEFQNLTFDYDEEDKLDLNQVEIVSVYECDLNMFYRNLNIVGYGEVVSNFRILKSRRFPGWCDFLGYFYYKGASGKSPLVYDSSHSDDMDESTVKFNVIYDNHARNLISGRSNIFSDKERHDQINSGSAFINSRSINLDEYNKLLQKECRKFIYVDLSTYFIEILIHTFVQGHKISFLGTKEQLLAVTNGEFLAPKFQKTYFHVIDNISYGLNKDASVVFISHVNPYYSYSNIPGINIFVGCYPIVIDFENGYFLNLEEQTEKDIFDHELNPNEAYIFDDGDAKGNNYNGFVDNEINLNSENTKKLSSFIKSLFRNRFYFLKGWFYFPEKRIKIKIEENITISKF